MKVDAATRTALAEIGAMMRATRLRAGISQATLAERIGMERVNYLRIEHGRANVTIETLVRVAIGLGVDLSVRYVPPKPESRTSRPSRRRSIKR